MSFFITYKNPLRAIRAAINDYHNESLIITSGADGLFSDDLKDILEANHVTNLHNSTNAVIDRYLDNILISEMQRPNISSLVDRDSYFKSYIFEVFSYINDYSSKLNVIIPELSFMASGIKLDSIYTYLIEALELINNNKPIKLALYFNPDGIINSKVIDNKGKLPKLHYSFDKYRTEIKNKTTSLNFSDEMSKRAIANITTNYLFGSYELKFPKAKGMKAIFKEYSGGKGYLYKLALQIASPRSIERIKDNPIGREKLFRLFIALHMDFGALLEMLTINGYSFDPNNKLDRVILNYVAYLENQNYVAEGELEFIKFLVNESDDLEFRKEIIDELFNM